MIGTRVRKAGVKGPRAALAAALAALAGCSMGGPAEEATAAAPPVPSPAASRAKPAGPVTFAITGQPIQGGWIRGVAPGGTTGLSLDGRPVAIAPDGRFFAAFDRDAGPAATLVAVRTDGSRVTQPLAVAPRAWNIERVNIARRPGGATDDFMRIRAPELARISEARMLDTGSQGWRQDFVWPAKGRISGRFGSQRIYRGGEPGAYHSGLDIATGTSGTPFVAPADGVVILAAETSFTLEGHLLMIDHGMGLNSAFLHCSQLLVREGDRVRQGQVIGKIGMSGRATGPHLHWSIKWNDTRLDPLLFLPPAP